MPYKEPIGFSKLDTFRACPKKFEFQYIKKLPTPTSPALDRGGRIHEEIEGYMRGWSPDLPPEAEGWKDAFNALRNKGAKTEAAWGFNRQWKLLDNWFAKDTWLRAKSDAHLFLPETRRLQVFDWKTGKYRVPSIDQIELYAICGEAIYHGQVDEVEACFWFIDAGEVYTRVYTAAELVALRAKYEAEFDRLSNNSQWDENPSRECRWCPFSSSHNGQCQF